MNIETQPLWATLMTNILIWMNFTTWAWELKKTIFDSKDSPSYQIEMKNFKVAGLENKQSKIIVVQEKEKTHFTYDPCIRIQKETK